MRNAQKVHVMMRNQEGLDLMIAISAVGYNARRTHRVDPQEIDTDAILIVDAFLCGSEGATEQYLSQVRACFDGDLYVVSAQGKAFQPACRHKPIEKSLFANIWKSLYEPRTVRHRTAA